MTEQPDVRASDQDRDAVAEKLRVAVGEGRITLEEFNERIEDAYTARTRGQLDALVADLPLTGVPVPAGRATPPAVPAGDVLELHVRSGKVVRDGRWTVPAYITAKAARFGTVKIDFTRADCPYQEVVLDVEITSWFGDVVLIVPRGWLVRDEEVVRRRLGAVFNRPPVSLAHDGVVIRLTGYVQTGDVWVRYR
ncbi:DUF1707 domain-containing protein [Nonomuraea sp. MCN248]|uniref:DUF1707 domain-containing protein n=1 Tax=Nonomuraea corallina TaxID=2989783 RepID=A0ABT4SLD9_9ACTN|nr:DUF1707 domain-containing protein [Nonomuraea corallina]MDA0637900.1 DUF1707 domain-containing protein [Nonomuraea corallina]